VVREGWGQGGEMNQALYAHMNNKNIYIYINDKDEDHKNDRSVPKPEV
jgi:hypothetical protein